jgi:hypothetical protein
MPGDRIGQVTATGDPDRPLVFEDTAVPGIYTLNPDNEKKTQLFAVNLESFESKLDYLAPPENEAMPREAMEAILKEKLPNRPLLSFVADPGQVNEVSMSARRGTRLWDTILWIVLIVALFEPWLANRISVLHYARPKDVAVLVSIGRTGRPEVAPQAEEVRS